MRKPTLKSLVIILCLLALTACGPGQGAPGKTSNSAAPGSDSAEGPSATDAGNLNTLDAAVLFDGIELPDNVTNPFSGTLSWPSEANVYHAQYSFSERADAIAATLLGEEAVDLGDGHYEKGSFSLKISNNSVRLTSERARLLNDLIPVNAREYPIAPEQLAGIAKSDYGSEDLPFLPLVTAVENTKTALQVCGVSNAELYMTCSLDAETMTEKARSVAEYQLGRESIQPEEREYFNALADTVFTDADSCYLLVFRLEIEGIPVHTATGTQTQREICGAEMYCLYGADGFLCFNLIRVPNTLSREGESIHEVCSPRDAALAILPKFTTELALTLESVGLYYTYYNKDYEILTPTWVFVTSYQRNPIPNDSTEVTEYLYSAVNALTGEVVVYDIRM